MYCETKYGKHAQQQDQSENAARALSLTRAHTNTVYTLFRRAHSLTVSFSLGIDRIFVPMLFAACIYGRYFMYVFFLLLSTTWLHCFRTLELWFFFLSGFVWNFPQNKKTVKNMKSEKTSSKCYGKGNSHLTSGLSWVETSQRTRGANNPWRNVEIIERYMCFDQWITFVLTRPRSFAALLSGLVEIDFQWATHRHTVKRKQINWKAIQVETVTHLLHSCLAARSLSRGITWKKGAKDLSL